jgi:NodT family efflux transporter outer membrane factor (OMF) lipoprotein
LAGDASWEIDFFGRNQRLTDAAEAEAEAAEADLRAAWVSLSAEVAMRYIELRTLQGRLMIAEDTLGVQESNVRLLTDRSKGGISSDLDRIQAEYDLKTTAAAIPAIKAQIATTENIIALLCGVTPGTLPAEIVSPKSIARERSSVDEQGTPQVMALRMTNIPRPEHLPLSAGIPAQAISQRPDVISAERALKAAVDKVGAAEAEHYPRVFISGSLGLDSIHLGDLADWDSHFYSFGPGISLPIFNGGRINANVNIKTENQKAALAIYEQTVLTALSDIRTAISGYAYEEERLIHLRDGVHKAATAYDIAYNAYTAGKLRFFEVLDAQRSLFNLDESRVISEGAMAQAQVQLYKALCGGWTLDAEDAELATYFFGADAPAEPLLEPIAEGNL